MIAEGVETSAQLATLCALGCDEMQGWLYSRALSAAAFEALAAGHEDNAWRAQTAPDAGATLSESADPETY